MQLGAALALGAVVARALAGLRAGAQRPAVQDGGTWLRRSPLSKSQHGTQVVGQRVKAPGRKPTLHLLVDRRPGWQVVGHPTPARAGLKHVAQAVEHLAQGMPALSGRLRQQR